MLIMRDVKTPSKVLLVEHNFLAKKVVSWSSKKQDCTSLSTVESEYVSLSTCCAQVLWMRTQLIDYGYHFDKIPIYCDSKSAIAISCNPDQHSRMKHIAAKDHDIKFYCSNDIKLKIKILDHQHAEGTAKNSQDNKVLRYEANCNYHQRERVVSRNNYTRMTYNNSTRKSHPSSHKNMAPRAVLMKIGLRPLNTARPVNTAHPKTIVYSARPMSCFSKSAHSTVKRPYQQRTALPNKSFSQKVNTAKGKFNTSWPRAVNTARPNSAVVNAIRGHPQQMQKDQGYVDSGCSRHMTGNMSYLSDFKNLMKDMLPLGEEQIVEELLQNGVAKRRNRTLIKAARTMLADSKLPTTFWAEAVNNACKAFKVYNIRTKRVEENLHIEFLENKPIVVGAGPEWLFDIDILIKSMNYVPVILSEDAGSPSSGDDGKKLDGMPGLETIATNDDSKEEADFTNLESSIHVSPTPTTKIYKNHPLKQVIGSLNTPVQTRSKLMTTNEQGVAKALFDPAWVEAMQEELLQFKLQKGHTQEEGIDYDEVFSLVARIEAIRLFLAYASFMGFMVYQMDAKSAFLYGRIEEEVYVCQPLGFEDPDHPDKVYKVVKALYGLHQAPRAWYETLANYLLGNECHRGKINQTLFIKRQKGDILLVQVYVDDIIFGSTKKELCTEFERLMKDKFYMSSIRELTFFLGLQIKQNKEAYLSARINMLLRSMIGPLMYLTSSRPDIITKLMLLGKLTTAIDVNVVDDEHVTTTSNDPLSETTKANQALVIRSLKRRVKKLEKKASKKTHKLKILYKIGSSTRVESSEDAGLGDQGDASKLESMIEDINADEGVALGDETHGRNDQDMFDTITTAGVEVVTTAVVAEKEVSTAEVVHAAGEVVNTTGVEVSTAAIASQISKDDITLDKALIHIKTSKPKVKGIVIQEPSKTSTPTPIDSSQQTSKAKDKGKAKMIEPKQPLKGKIRS
nr:hypothetical protein [Tanacetum cinerariifolium]